jgi:hypothetical protein
MVNFKNREKKKRDRDQVEAFSEGNYGVYRNAPITEELKQYILKKENLLS